MKKNVGFEWYTHRSHFFNESEHFIIFEEIRYTQMPYVLQGVVVYQITNTITDDGSDQKTKRVICFKVILSDFAQLYWPTAYIYSYGRSSVCEIKMK